MGRKTLNKICMSISHLAFSAIEVMYFFLTEQFVEFNSETDIRLKR